MRSDESDLKRKVEHAQGWTGYLLCMEDRKDLHRGNAGQIAIMEEEQDKSPGSEEQIHTLLAVEREHEQQAEGDQDRKQTRFNVLTAVQEVITVPQALRQGRSSQQDAHET